MKRRDFIKKTGAVGSSLLTSSLLFAGSGPLSKLIAKRKLAGTPEGAGQVAGGAQVAAAKGGFADVAAGTFRTRKEARSTAAAADLELYSKAVIAMRAIPHNENNPTGWSWETQAHIHNKHCPHSTWGFFPWHREYLCRFEEIIRQVLLSNRVQNVDPNAARAWALPYWDWTNNAEIPDAFNNRNGKTPGLVLPQDVIQRNTNATSMIKQATSGTAINRILATKDFNSIMGKIRGAGSPEAGPHNVVHGALGANGSHMGDFMSPLDPIFWVHHCNVDRIWAVLQEKDPTLYKDSISIEKTFPLFASHELLKGGPMDRTGGFYYADGKPVNGDTKAARAVLDTKTMEIDKNPVAYTYDNLKGPQTAFNFTEEPNRGLAAASSYEAIQRSTGSKIVLKPQAYTLDDLPTQNYVEKGINGTSLDLILPDRGFKLEDGETTHVGRTVRKFFDEYLEADSAKRKRLDSDYVYRLRLEGLPEKFEGLLTLNMIVNDKKIFVTQYAPFTSKKDPSEQGHRHHGPYRFYVDFSHVLKDLKKAKLKEFPEVSEILVTATESKRALDSSLGIQNVEKIGFKFIVDKKVETPVDIPTPYNRDDDDDKDEAKKAQGGGHHH